MIAGEVARSASFSTDGRYRYRLDRRWSDGLSLTWIMLNPSTADASTDDPTIRRCMDFGARWGFGAITVVNLFAWRATRPAELLSVTSPVGPRNNRVLRDAVAEAATVVAAWGSLPASLRPRAEAVRSTLPGGAVALGMTRSGEPRHPLYVRGGVAPVMIEDGVPACMGRGVR